MINNNTDLKFYINTKIIPLYQSKVSWEDIKSDISNYYTRIGLSINDLESNIYEAFNLINVYKKNPTNIGLSKLKEHCSICFIDDYSLQKLLELPSNVENINNDNQIKKTNSDVPNYKRQFILSSIFSLLLAGLLIYFYLQYVEYKNDYYASQIQITDNNSELELKNQEVVKIKNTLDNVKNTLLKNNKWFVIQNVEFKNEKDEFASSFKQSNIRYATPKISIYSFLDEEKTMLIKYDKKMPSGHWANFEVDGLSDYYVKQNFIIKPGENTLTFSEGWGQEIWEIGSYNYTFYLDNSFENYSKSISIE